MRIIFTKFRCKFLPGTWLVRTSQLKCSSWLVLGLAAGVFLSKASASNVLLFLVGTTQFERQSFEFLAQQLARRHHNTITVKPILIPEEPRLVQPRLHFVTEKVLRDLLPKRLYEPLQAVGGDVPWRTAYEFDAFYEPYWRAHVYACKKMLNSNLMEVIARDQIDVALVYAGNPCQLAIVYALNIPFVYVDLDGFSDETRVVSRTPWALTSLDNEAGSEPLTRCVARKLTRALALLCETIAQREPPDWLLASLWCGERVRQMDAPISRLFAEDYEIRRRFRAGFPTVNEIKGQAQFYLVNTDPLLHSEQPVSSNVIHIGGFHIDSVRPLFSPWNESLDAAADGVILVSLGTQADVTRDAARGVMRALYDALAPLTRYRVFWRVAPKLTLPPDVADPAGVPAHINFTTFIPQNELLAHPRTRLLITNGGAHSVAESLAHGVPIFGVPLYGHNRAMLADAQRVGVALVLEKANLTRKSVHWALRELLNDSKYLNKAREMAREIRRRPSSAFESALNAIEIAAARLQRAGATRARRPSRPFYLALEFNADLAFFALIGVITVIAASITVLIVSFRLARNVYDVLKRVTQSTLPNLYRIFGPLKRIRYKFCHSNLERKTK